MAILRVGHLRKSEYELQQHRRIALTRGVDLDTQAAVFAWPAADGALAPQPGAAHRVDELVATRTLSDETWQRLAAYLDRRQLMEFVMLVAQYDGLAMWLNTLGVPMDYPDRVTREAVHVKFDETSLSAGSPNYRDEVTTEPLARHRPGRPAPLHLPAV